MLNFNERTGPDNGIKYPEFTPPKWWLDAKLGFFIHLGLYSIPAFAVNGEQQVGVEDAYAYHRYAEWYANTVRIENSPSYLRHRQIYGEGTTYEDLAQQFQIQADALEQLVDKIASLGAKYLIPTAKHHDGYCLWDTKTTSFNSVQRGPKFDLIDVLAKRARAKGLKFGTYFSGALDWHVSDFPPIQSDRELFIFRRQDQSFAKYCASQLSELITNYRPDILWNDIEWPNSGKTAEPYGLKALFELYRAQVPNGVINDRWGVEAKGHLTREYRTIDKLQSYPFEATRGLSSSFGYNQLDTLEHTLSAAELVRYFVDVVAKGGNLLLNIGPTASGEIPAAQLAPLAGLKQFMDTFGFIIYGSSPFGEGVYGQSYWLENQEKIYVFAPPGDEIKLPPSLGGASLRWIENKEITFKAPVSSHALTAAEIIPN